MSTFLTALFFGFVCGGIGWVGGWFAKPYPKLLISIKVGGSVRPVIMGTVGQFMRKCAENGGAMRARIQGVTVDVVDLSISPPKKENEK